MPPPQADFRRIKQRIPIDGVLARYGVKLRLVGPHTLRGPCPLPTHTSRQSRESFSANLSRQVWSCHSASCIAARDGRLGGHVIDLVAIMEHCSLRHAGLRLQDWFGAPASDPEPYRPAVEPASAAPNRPLGFALLGIDSRHPYLTHRGISPATAQWFGVGMYRGAGFLAGRVVIPIRDENGHLVAYAGRAINGEAPKYRFPAGFRKSQVLFNLVRAMRTGARQVIVVEGFFDALGLRPEYVFGFNPEWCSESARNPVRLQPGMLFGLPRIPHPPLHFSCQCKRPDRGDLGECGHGRRGGYPLERGRQLARWKLMRC